MYNDNILKIDELRVDYMLVEKNVPYLRKKNTENILHLLRRDKKRRRGGRERDDNSV